MSEEHWSSPNGCHPDCPACAEEGQGGDTELEELQQRHTDLLATLQDVELRMTQARLATTIGRKKNRTDFLLDELERMRTIARAAIAKDSEPRNKSAA